jgi:hypothetical protein
VILPWLVKGNDPETWICLFTDIRTGAIVRPDREGPRRSDFIDEDPPPSTERLP